MATPLRCSWPFKKKWGGDSDCANIRIRGPRSTPYGDPGNRSSYRRLCHNQRCRSHNSGICIRLRKRWVTSPGGNLLLKVDPDPQVLGPLVLGSLSEVTIPPTFTTNNRHSNVDFAHPFFSFTEGESMWMSLDRSVFS